MQVQGNHTFSLEGAKLPNFYQPKVLANILARIPQTEVYWFGSRVWGNANERSDFDLCVVVCSEIDPGCFRDRVLLLNQLVRLWGRGYNPEQSNVDIFVLFESTQVDVEQEIIQNARRGIRVVAK